MEAAMHLQQQTKPYRNLRGGNSQNKHKHYLPIRCTPSRAYSDEREPAGIQHHFDRHQDKYNVAANDHTGQANTKQYPGQQ
jgi:hypothetical protein